jgi:hypothetical protein
MGDIDRTTEALGNTIAVGLAPVVADLAERFGEWFRANEEVIAQRVPEVIDSIVTSGVAAVEWAVGFADDVTYLANEIENMADIVGGGLVDAYATVRPLIDTVTDAVQAALVPFRAAAEEMAEIVDQMAEAVGLADEIRGTDGERSILAKVLDPWGVAQGALMDGDSTGIERGTSGRAAENRARRQALGQSTSSAGVDPSMPRAQLEAMALDTSLHPVVRRQARQAALAQASRERDAVDRAAREVEAQRAKDADAAQREAEVDARRKRGDAYAGKLRASAAGGGGGSKVDTREARELFGAEFEALARAAGVGDRAIRAALESAASSLESGASQAVARQAGVGQLESLSGASLSAAGGPDAALFGLLTQLGGPQAARSAADGARFVQISNTFNVTNTFSLELPPGFGAGLQRDVEGVGGSLSRLLVDQWEAVIDRFGQGVEP